ncbi:MAG TPA: DsbE family thiol:disulfide interchange protein [Nevskiaceae bacterium]|nr:DsbE family thiol:disulfide interchange protein [Nevskiaceae bacterium]
MRLRYFIPVLVVIGLVVVLGFGLFKNPTLVPTPYLNKPAPAFDAATLENPARHVTLADFRGRPTVVNFFASWCVACRQEHPFLMQLAQADHVRLVGVDYKDTIPAVKQDLAAHGDPYHLILLDPQGAMGLNWGVYGVPETFVLDAYGIVRYKQIGPITPAAWREHVEPLLRGTMEARR